MKQTLGHHPTQPVCGLVIALAAQLLMGCAGNGDSSADVPLLGLRLLVLHTETGATLDEKPISSTEFATVGTTLSEEGDVYVPGLFGGIWAFAPDR